MSGPSSPRGLLSWAASVTASSRCAHSPRYDDSPRRDRRLNFTRESAIYIVMLLERSANGDGGAGLVYDFYTRDISWHAFTDEERKIMNRTIRIFRKKLVDAGFLSALEKQDER